MSQEYRKTTEQRQLCEQIRPVKLQDGEDEQKLLELSRKNRMQYEAEIRERLRSGMELFLNEGTLQDEIIKFNQEPRFKLIEDLEPRLRCGVFIRKLLEAFDIVSDRIIASYNWEVNASDKAPMNPT